MSQRPAAGGFSVRFLWASVLLRTDSIARQKRRPPAPQAPEELIRFMFPLSFAMPRFAQATKKKKKKEHNKTKNK